MVKTVRKWLSSNIKVWIICGLPVLAAIIWDILIRYADVPYLHVTDDYIGIVFGGLCTVAALGSAVQSIIIGAYNNRIFGFSVRDIVNFRSNSVSLKRTNIISLGAIVLAIPMLAIGFCSSISMLTVVVVVYLVYTSAQVWRLLSNTEYERAMIHNEVNACGSEKPEYFLNAWFSELETAISENDATRQNDYIALIKSIVDKCSVEKKDISNILGKYLTRAFDSAYFPVGFVEAYNQILCLNAPRTQMNADIDSIVSRFVNNIEYATASEISKYQVPNTIDDLIENLSDESDKIRYAYTYFCAIIKNSIISDEARLGILNSSIEKLCYLRDSGTGIARGTIILYITKTFVFENDNQVEREKVFEIIIWNLFNENRYSGDACYFSVLSQLFRGLYFYSMYETETLSEDYRKELAKLYSYGHSGKNNFQVTLSSLVSEHPERVIKWLVDDAVDGEESYHLFDYFPANFFVKNSIWAQEDLIRFAFCMYAIWGYNFSCFPADNIVNDDSVDIQLRQRICRTILGLADDQFQLSDQAIALITQMQTFVGKTTRLSEQYFQDNFSFFNKKLSSISEEINKGMINNASAKADEVFAELKPKLKEFSPFVLNSDISIKAGQRIAFRPTLRTASKDDANYSAQRKAYEIREVLNRIIEDTLPSEQIGFDSNGVKKLLELTQQNKYLLRNYEYVNDWAIKKEVRGSEEFSQLVTALQSIPYVSGRDLNQHVFLKVSAIEFNVSIESYSLDTPTDEQCEEYLNSCKISEGKYRIDGIVHDYTRAMEYAKSSYVAESSEIIIATNITKDSGFAVRFR